MLALTAVTNDSSYDSISEISDNEFCGLDSEENSTPTDGITYTDDSGINTDITAVTETTSQVDLYTIAENQKKIIENTDRSLKIQGGILFAIILGLGAWAACLFGKWIWSLIRC